MSQFDRETSAIESIQTFAIEPLLEKDERPVEQRSFVASDLWTPTSPMIRIRPLEQGFEFDGDQSQFGYQVMGPRFAVGPLARVNLTMAVKQERGAVCVGVLNGTEQRWIVSPVRADTRYEFKLDATGAFRVVLANCNAAPGQASTRASLEAASFASAVNPPSLYSDRLLKAGSR